MAKFVKLIPLLIAVALLAGVPSAVSGQAPGEPFAWNPAADLHFPPANEDPKGIWSDKTTIWVADDGRDKIYAYNLATKQRDAAKDFDTLIAAGNVRPQGLWSDGITIWVSDYGETDPKPKPRWDVHFEGLEVDREQSKAPHLTFSPQIGDHRRCDLSICTFHLGFGLVFRAAPTKRFTPTTFQRSSGTPQRTLTPCKKQVMGFLVLQLRIKDVE